MENTILRLFEMMRRSNTSLGASGSGSSVLVSETHRVLHESRLITLLPETIHTDLAWPLSCFTNRFISGILLFSADNEIRINYKYFISIFYLKVLLAFSITRQHCNVSVAKRFEI